MLKLDANRREVVVGPREALRAKAILLREVNWLGDESLESIGAEGVDIMARIRSSGALQPARLKVEGAEISVELADGEDGISPGQACVFYSGSRVLGGGWIRRETAAKAA